MFLGDTVTYMGDDPTAGVTYPDLSNQPLPVVTGVSVPTSPYDPNFDETGQADLNAIPLQSTTTGLLPAPAPVTVGALQMSNTPFYIAAAIALYYMTKRGGSRLWL